MDFWAKTIPSGFLYRILFLELAGEFFDGRASGAPVNHVLLLGVGNEEALVADGVDEPGDPFGAALNAPESKRGKGWVAVGPGDFEAVFDVLLGFRPRERVDVKPHGDSLMELAKIGLLQLGTELRLADEGNLEKFSIVRLEI